MKKKRYPAMRAVLASVVLAGMVTGEAFAQAPAPRVLSEDLNQVRSQFTNPEQIAMARPVSLDSSTTGTGWTKGSDGLYTWSDSIQVPGATMLALRFPGMKLPVGSDLTLTNPKGFRFVYSPADINPKAFTSVYVSGDTLTVTVRTVKPQDVSVKADKVYVGTDNPIQSQSVQNPQSLLSTESLWNAAAAQGTSVLPAPCSGDPYSDACRQALLVNYACKADVTTATQSRSAIAYTLSSDASSLSCSGTLVNNTKGDGHAYVVSAAHCAGEGKVPDYANATITLYWPRIVGNCGDPYYDPATNTFPTRIAYQNLPASYGPVSNNFSIVAHQDHVPNPHVGDTVCRTGSKNDNCVVGADMLLLEAPTAPPLGANPYWAGINAKDTTNADVAVAYGISSNPMTGVGGDDPSFGAFSFDLSFPLNSPMTIAKDSTYGVKNGWDNYGIGSSTAGAPGGDGPSVWCADFTQDLGNVEKGSSGSALFDANGVVRGIYSFAFTGGGSVCPNGYYRMDLAWNNTYNGVANALKTYLDPANTGVLTVPGFEDTSRSDNLTVILGALEDANVAAGGTVDLVYYTDEATSCTASSLPATGVTGWNQAVTVKNKSQVATKVTVPGASTLTLICTNAAGYQKAVSVDIDGGGQVTTVNPFSFPSVTGATPGAVVKSSVITPTGYNVPVSVSISGGQYSVNGGAFTSAPGSIAPGQTLQLELTAPAAGQSANAVVVLGSGSTGFGQWMVTSASGSSSSSSSSSGGSSSSSSSGGTSSSSSSSSGGSSSGTTPPGGGSSGGGGAFGFVELFGLVVVTVLPRRRLKPSVTV